MGFYGRIADTSNIHFQFDKIYPNRTTMDSEALFGQDNIFAGRFVLVKYNPEGDYPYYTFFSGYEDASEMNAAHKILYADRFFEHPFIYTDFTAVANPSQENWNLYYFKDNERYIKLTNEEFYVEGTTYYTPTVQDEDNIVGQGDIIQLKSPTTGEAIKSFYKCYAEENSNRVNSPAYWSEIILDEDYGDYFINYQIDEATYGGKFNNIGYDATVWQKVYSEGQGKFVLIASLNGGNIPSFELFPNPPSIDPQAPYIDSKSTDSLYRIHVPTRWGFNFKQEAPVHQGGLSEETFSYNKLEYDAQGNPVGTTPTTIDADIFINKAGADVAMHNRNEEVSNTIEFSTTGTSGKKYFDGNGYETYTDTIELSVHVPAIGNMISDGYDMMYGYFSRGIYDEDTGELVRTEYPRYTDISWIDGSASAEEKYNGYEGLKTHDLNTLAGTLNTMHDRLGQNVIHLEAMPSDEQASLLSDDYIYEIHGGFYRRGIKYNRITVDDYIYILDSSAGNHFNNPPEGEHYYYKTGAVDQNGDPIYAEASSYDVNITYYYRKLWCVYVADGNASTTFSTNKYYENVGTQANPSYTPSQDTSYHSGKTYYLKNINPSRFSEVTLIPWIPNRYFLLDGENYICDKREGGPSDPYRQYYTITNPTEMDFSVGYEANKYYKKDSKGDYFMDSSAEPDPLDNSPYYGLGAYSPSYTENGQPVPCIYYIPNKFYYEKKQTEPGVLHLATESELVTGDDRTYYALTFKDTPKYGKYNDEIILYYEEKSRVDVTDKLLGTAGSNIYYVSPGARELVKYSNLDKFLGDEAYSVARVYYRIPNGSFTEYPVNSFYLPRRYFIYNENGDYVKANSTEFDEDAHYYLLNSNSVHQVESQFYEQNKYYYDTTNGQRLNFSIAPESSMVHDKYYIKARFYVDYDEANQCPHGYEWSDYVPYVPPSIHLYAREEALTLVPMDRVYVGDPSMTSVNELLLYLSRTYDENNEETRDLSTFRGTLNSIRDLLYQIKTLAPGKLLYVNDFGQITSTDIDYLTAKSILT